MTVLTMFPLMPHQIASCGYVGPENPKGWKKNSVTFLPVHSPSGLLPLIRPPLLRPDASIQKPSGLRLHSCLVQTKRAALKNFAAAQTPERSSEMAAGASRACDKSLMCPAQYKRSRVAPVIIGFKCAVGLRRSSNTGHVACREGNGSN